MMELQLPAEIFKAVEEKRLVSEINKELGLECNYIKGVKMILSHEDPLILDLAVDTLKFWISDDTNLTDNFIRVLEGKKVVWKFYGTYARKVLHLFEESLIFTDSGDITIAKNNKIKKNVSLLEVSCSYSDFRKVDSKIETICKGVENLKVAEIKVKPNDRVRAMRFVESKLDSDNTVLCIYSAKEIKLEIFAKSDEKIAKVKREFEPNPVKMTGRGKRGNAGSGSRTTVIHVTANETDKAKTAIREEKYKNPEESDKVTHLTNSTRKDESVKEIQASAESQQTDLKTNTNLTESTKMPKENGSLGSASADTANFTFTNSEREFSKSKHVPDNAMANQSPAVTLGTGSRFRYEFELYGLKVILNRESIVDVKSVDAIVNAANEQMAHDRGVAYYISNEAGKMMDKECRTYVTKYGRVKVGDNCVTSAGRLPFQGIIHAVGPQWADYVGKEDKCAEVLYFTIKNTLKRAKDYKWRRIALCAISAGIYGVPKELCAEMYVKALVDFNQKYAGSLAEVQFVDVNPEILGCIKDAHGKWLKSPDCLNFQNAKKYPSDAWRKPSNSTYLQISTFQQSVTDPGPVKYIGQFKTAFDGHPVYEFMLHGVLKVQIYTGNLVKLSNVDAIACSVNDRLSGGLAHVISQEAGLEYQTEIGKFKRPGRNSRLYDGDVFICTGGRLRVKKVLHVVIGKTIDSANGEALSRLQLVNQRILEEANTSMLRRLAMPLIGAGALRTEKDIAACGHRLAKDVMEFFKNNRTRLHIEEIHIINQDDGKSVLMFDTFRQLERNMQTVKQASGGTSGRDLSGSYISSQKQTSVIHSSEREKRFKETKSEKNKMSGMALLETKKLKCASESCDNYAEWTMMCGHSYCGVCSIILKEREKCFKCQMSHADKEEKVDTVSKVKVEKLIGRKTAEEETDTAVGKTEEENNSCPVCLCDFTNPTALPCGHLLCQACLDQSVMTNENKKLLCEVKVPDDLVQKLEQLPGGIQPTLAKIEKEYGISASSASFKHFSITGPSPEILDVAIETLEQIEAEERRKNEESVTPSALEDKRSAWKFFGEYARKATHLFLPELKELQRVESVIVQEKKNCLAITCSYDDTNAVKVAVNQLENALHELHEDEVKITAKDKDIDKIYKFIQNTQKQDKTVLVVLNAETKTAKISGKIKHHVQRVADNLRSGKVTEPLVLPVLVKSKKFEHHLKLPPGIVKKIEKQKGGIFPIIAATEKEFGLEIKYVRDKHFIIFGPIADVLELMAQTLVLRYVMKAPLENGIIGILQRQNAVWKFLGEYAKKVNHLFKRELTSIERIKTVTIRAFPCQINPTCVEILCSVKVVQHVKADVERLVNNLNKLFGHHVRIPDTDRDKQNVREFVRFRHEHDTTVLCIFEEESHTLTIFGRNLYIVRQVANEVQAIVTSVQPTVPVPDKIKNTYRQMYQTKLNDAVVERLQKRSGGLVPIIQRVEKEYGLKAIYNKNKVALVSPSEEVLELATETMEARYSADMNRHGRFGIIGGKPRCLQMRSKIEKC